ncbi:hypothetical protein D3C83_253460 [compost metagenome]
MLDASHKVEEARPAGLLGRRALGDLVDDIEVLREGDLAEHGELLLEGEVC